MHKCFIPIFIIVLVAGSFGATLALQHGKRPSSLVAAPLRSDEANARLIEKLDAFYSMYLAGDLDAARRALLNQISYLEALSEPDLPPIAKPNGMWLAYCRLFVLENSAGRAKEASQAFEKARFWYAQRLQHWQGTALSPAQQKTALDKFNEETCTAKIKGDDNTFTNNRGPHYLTLIIPAASMPASAPSATQPMIKGSP